MIRNPFHIVRFVLITICLSQLASHSFSQNVFASEDDLKKQANKLFEEEDFAKAYPLFSQLLSLYPKDPQYNYKFGTCLLFSSNDKEKAIPYIEYAAKRQKQGVDKEVFFYLGKAYHLNYRFADAIRVYTVYKGMASSRQLEKYDVNRQVEMCESGKRLLQSITELSVLEKKEVPVSDFFRSYNLTEFNAKLIIKPEDLKTSFDKKKKDKNIMYLAPDRNQIYYSSYGEDGKNRRDIFFVMRTAVGDISKSTRLSDIINTKYDEDYAFLHPNGTTLYFCSKGHNSMGGYDIFKSEWKESTQSWGKPVNMDFPINTPDDDILFISDSEDKSAYFSSGRESAEGNISVYKIKLDRKPLDLAIITGTLTKDVGDKMPDAKITVTKILKDEVVGVFNTNATDGSYTLKLPNGGKFMFTLESPGFKKSSELVVVPVQREIKPLKQAMALVNENGQDKVVIKNEFDEQVDSADLALAVQYIKAKASLEVSPAEEEIKEITSVVVNETTSTSILNSEMNSEQAKTEPKNVIPVSNTDIIAIAYEDARQTQKDANESRKNSDAAQQLANQKNNLSMEKYKEAQELIKSAEAITNQEEKMVQSDKATQLRKESEILSKEAAMTLTLSNQMDELANAKQRQADAELKYAKELDNAIASGASENKMNELLAQKEELEKESERLSAPFPPDMDKQAEEKQSEASKSMAKYLDMQQDVEDLKSEAKRLRAEAEKTKKDDVKQNLNQQADEMEKEAEAKKKDAEIYSASAKQLQLQADSIKNNASLTSSVMKEIQSSPESTTASSTASSNTNITSTYVDVFVNQMYEAEKKPNELEKEESLSVIYQSWTDSLDNQISSLKKQLSSTSSEENKAQIQNKIYELQSSVDDKRQKAANSRNKVDNLKLQEALAAASTISPETTSSATVSPENLLGTENINNYYENKLKENEKVTNEYSKKSNEERIYTDWASSLYDESQRLKKDGKDKKAEDAEKESKVKQVLAMETANHVTQIKAEHPDWVEAAKAEAETTSSITTTETKPESTTSSSLISPETTTVPTNTITATNPVTAETSSSTTTETSGATTKSESINPLVSQSALSTTPPESVKNKDEYTHYVALKNESDWSKKNADRQYKQADAYQKLSDEQLKESQQIFQQITNNSDPEEKKNLQQKADDMDRNALRSQAKADSIKQIAINSEAESNSKRTESELYLQSLDKSAYEEIVSATAYKTSSETATSTTAKTESTTQPETTTTTSTEIPIAIGTTNTTTATNPFNTEPVSPTTTSFTAKTNTETTTQPTTTETTTSSTKTESTNPLANATVSSSSEVLKYYDAIFDKLEFAGSSYSFSKPIPVNAPMPEGLVFKVQIGAFRNPIPQDLFKGLKPIVAETTPMGFKRYTAGLFQKFGTANDAKNQIKGLGYRDAFVVAFFNGKRIPMNDALSKAKETGENIDVAAASSAGSSNNTILLSESAINIENATDVKSVSGLFYTIQIGVFSQPVSSTQLYNISPLNNERTDNGLIRYTTGRFSDAAKADMAKNNIAQKGISDAFVVAYFNGKRISLAAAKNMIDSQGKDILSKDKQEYSFASSDTTTSESSATSLTTSANLGIVFKVQIGAFKELVPIAVANKFLSIARQGIQTYKDETGLMIYTVGEFLEYESANNLKTKLINDGLNGAFVIAFKDGKKITASAALEMIKNR